MPVAIASNYRLSYNKETAWGTPVTTGAKYVRPTGASLASQLGFIQSGEISAVHRERAGMIPTSAMGGGTVDAEMTYLTYEDWLGSLFGNDWTGTTVRTLKPGRLLRPLTLQEDFNDITQLVSYPGAIATQWTLNVQQGAVISTQFTFASKKGVPAATTAIGTPTAANTNPVMDPLGSIQVLTENGSPIALPQSFSLQVASDLINVPSLLVADPGALYQGFFTVTGSFAMAKQDAAMMTKYLNRTGTNIVLTIGGASAKKVEMTMSAVTLTSENRPVQGNQFVQETYGFAATYDATNGSLKLLATD